MFNINKEEKLAIVKVNSEKLNSINSPELKNHFVKLSSEDMKNVILDLSEVKFCDSSGLSAILVGNRVSKNSDGTFVVSGIKDMVEKLIQISQLDSILNITPTISEARDLIFMDEVQRSFDSSEE
jgi:anti-sigma B factor antagonist